MPDFRVNDQQHTMDASREAGLAAMGLWAMAGSHAMSPAVLTDGWVSEVYVRGWPNGRRAAAALVGAGLWRQSTRDGKPGYQFVDWTKQRTAAQINAELEDARKRMRKIRSGQTKSSPERSGGVRPNNDRTAEGNGAVSKRTTYAPLESDTNTNSDHHTTTNEHRSPPATSDNPETFGRTHTEGSPNVHDSLTLTQSGTGGRESSPPAHARVEPPSGAPRTREEPPPPRCPQHLDDDTDTPCRGCGQARERRTTWDADATRRARQQQSADARRAAELRAVAAAECDLCDADGRWSNGRLCDHDHDRVTRADQARADALAALRKDTA